MPIHIQHVTESRGSICRAILAELPDWFGIPASIEEYATFADDAEMIGYVDTDGTVGGFAVLNTTSRANCDLHVLAVRLALHRRGIGKALIAEAVRLCRTRGLRYLSVKTLGPSRPNPAYDATRMFYESVGFEAIEELHGYWVGNPCLLMIMAL